MKKIVSSLVVSVFMLFGVCAYAHHLAPDAMTTFIDDQLIAVDSPHLLSTEDDPSLAALYTSVSSLDDVDYVAVIEGDDISEILAAIEEILLMLEDGNLVLDFEVIIEFDMDTGLYTVTLYVDFDGV